MEHENFNELDPYGEEIWEEEPFITTGLNIYGCSIAACDKRCSKAWGVVARPKIRFDNEDDYAFMTDEELGEAPRDPGTYEGGHGKPMYPDRHNKWCMRQCERCDLFKVGEEIKLRDFSKRMYNQPWKHKDDPINEKINFNKHFMERIFKKTHMIKLFEEYTKFKTSNKTIRGNDILSYYFKNKDLSILDDFKNKWIRIIYDNKDVNIHYYLLQITKFDIEKNGIFKLYVDYDGIVNMRTRKISKHTKGFGVNLDFSPDFTITIVDEIEVEEMINKELDPYGEEDWNDGIIIENKINEEYIKYKYTDKSITGENIMDYLIDGDSRLDEFRNCWVIASNLKEHMFYAVGYSSSHNGKPYLQYTKYIYIPYQKIEEYQSNWTLDYSTLVRKMEPYDAERIIRSTIHDEMDPYGEETWDDLIDESVDRSDIDPYDEEDWGEEIGIGDTVECIKDCENSSYRGGIKRMYLKIKKGDIKIVKGININHGSVFFTDTPVGWGTFDIGCFIHLK